ncbi:VIT1/CCC1 family predicted Fe2+/Mn2+ transporter [Glaciimonas immobilis]|uniref:VIT1/CCC1 family predicted Fe2+/Mn2+ transporter n=1 Tax=Glaciimonas immobilis TaxID=728004 RepID=A0A840RNT0_9BURK|nr:VIT1/CCC1 family predicted Fe2+/Mn2+ transporter [Glaciimonas immobilis]
MHYVRRSQIDFVSLFAIFFGYVLVKRALLSCGGAAVHKLVEYASHCRN